MRAPLAAPHTIQTNQAQNPSAEVNVFGFWSNDPTKYPVVRDTTAPISGTGSASTTRSPNLLTAGANGTFEGGVTTGWVTSGSPTPTFAADATRAHTGTGSMKVSWVTGTTSLAAVVAVGMATLVVGQSYTLEAWLYIPTGASDCSVAVTLIGSGNIVTQRDQWVLSTYTFTATVATHSMQVGPRATTVSGATVFVDDVRLYTTPDTIGGSIYSNGTAVNNSVFTLFPITPGVPVTWAMDVKTDQAGRRTRMLIGWRDASNVAAGTGPSEAFTNLTAGVAARVSSTGTPPANAAFAYGTVSVTTLAGNATVGEKCWFDNLYAGTDPSGVFFDGSTPGAYWNGAANASYSTRLSDVVNVAVNPGCESSSINWSSADVTKYPMYLDSSVPISGVASAYTIRTATTPNTAVGVVVVGSLPVTPGVSVTVAMDFRSELGNRQTYLQLNWRDAASVTIGNTDTGYLGIPTLNAGVVTRGKVTAIPIAGAVTAQFVATTYTKSGGGNAVVGERIWYDNLYCGPNLNGVYVDGNSPGCVWSGTPHLSSSVQVSDGAANLSTNPNVETNALGWYSNDGSLYPVTRDTTAPISGTASAMSTRTATSPDTVATSIYLSPVVAARYQVAPGQTYTVSVDMRAEQPNRKARMYFIWYAALTGGQGGTSQSPLVYQPLTDGVTTRVSHTATAPPNMNFCIATVAVVANTGNTVTGERVWFDNMRLSADPAVNPSTVTRTNLAYNPISDAYSVVGTFWAPSRGTLAVGPGNGFLRLTVNDATVSSMSQRINSPTTNAIHLATFPGETVRVACQVRSSASWPMTQALQFLDSGNNMITSPTGGTVATNPTTWTDIPELSAVAPAGAAYVMMQIGISGSGARAINDTFDVRHVVITKGTESTAPYFDGSFAVSAATWYRWKGAVDDSPSQQMLLVNTLPSGAQTAYFDGSSPGCVWAGTVNGSQSFKLLVPPYSQWDGAKAIPLNGAWQTTDAAGAVAVADFREVEVV